MIKTDHDEIWYWYRKIEEFKASGLTNKGYCDKYEIDYKKFNNKLYRIDYKRDCDPKEYEQLVLITRKYMKSGATAANFAKANDINIRILSQMTTHLRYRDIIESMRADKEGKPMQFIQVPVMNLPMLTPQEPEVVQKQNDIEIIITKGVKVSISPNIDSMKIIKIIELLKDL